MRSCDSWIKKYKYQRNGGNWDILEKDGTHEHMNRKTLIEAY